MKQLIEEIKIRILSEKADRIGRNAQMDELAPDSQDYALLEWEDVYYTGVLKTLEDVLMLCNEEKKKLLEHFFDFDVSLDRRVYNAVIRSKFAEPYDLYRATDDDIYRVRNIGKLGRERVAQFKRDYEQLTPRGTTEQDYEDLKTFTARKEEKN